MAGSAPENAAHRRLRWKCRRGLLELDLVLERFLDRKAEAFDSETLDLLNELLDYPDNDLWDIVNGRSEEYAPRHRPLVEVLRAS